MEESKKIEIQKQINFIFKEFDFKSNREIESAHKLLKAYEYNKDIEFYDIDDDFTNKKVIIKIKPFNDKNMVYIVEDDGKEG